MRASPCRFPTSPQIPGTEIQKSQGFGRAMALPGKKTNKRNRRAGFSPPVFRFAAWGSAMDLPGANCVRTECRDSTSSASYGGTFPSRGRLWICLRQIARAAGIVRIFACRRTCRAGRLHGDIQKGTPFWPFELGESRGDRAVRWTARFYILFARLCRGNGAQ